MISAAAYNPPVAPAAVVPVVDISTCTPCMYQSYCAGGGEYDSRGLLIEGTQHLYETPSPSRHSSDGSSTTNGEAVVQQNSSLTTMYNTAYQGPRDKEAFPENWKVKLYNVVEIVDDKGTKYWHEKVIVNRMSVQNSVEEVASILHSLLKQVEQEEPRFNCSLNRTHNNRYDGLLVQTPTEFHVLLYLNHMAVFNYIDDGSLPGCAALKLSDGRKRSMSLWVEFITASGYLSARKIRAKFQSLISQVMDKNKYTGIRIVDTPNDVILVIKETFTVHVTPAFTWKDTWPRLVGNWVVEKGLQWPPPSLVAEVMQEGITLIARESVYTKDKQSPSEGDAWLILLNDAEDRLLYSYSTGKKRVLSILKCLRDRHLHTPGGAPVTNHHLKTLILYEAEKHPCESDWEEVRYGERIQSILLQLIACLQSRQCLDYFQTNVDLYKGLDKNNLAVMARSAWSLLRLIIISGSCFDQL